VDVLYEAEVFCEVGVFLKWRYCVEFRCLKVLCEAEVMYEVEVLCEAI